MQASFDDIQKAFVDGRITLEQLVEVLVDNFGIKKASRIITHNIQLALNKESESNDS